MEVWIIVVGAAAARRGTRQPRSPAEVRSVRRQDRYVMVHVIPDSDKNGTDFSQQVAR
jgi:hypothetical protein